jgi:hypothetical protein
MFHPPIDPSQSLSSIESSQARDNARRAITETERLRFDLERVLMITEALWGILKEKHGYSDDELFQRVMEIDLRDGKADGKVATSGALACPHCNRTLMKNRPFCLYCGKPVQMDLFQR